MPLPRPSLDPPPLVTGLDLQGLGIAQGPIYSRVLARVRAAQLDGEVTDKPSALELAARLAAEGGTP